MSDLIDREDVIRIVQDRLNSPYMQNKWQQGACLSILRAIEELPSADTVSLEEFEQMRFLADKSMEMVGEERPKGEWIDAEIPLECGGSMPIQVCNLCKTFYPLAYTGGGHRFCPNCGARMKGADDE